MSNETEDKARKMGWVPKEEWRGNPDQWRDADTFVQRGEEILPILQANNRELLEKVNRLESTVQEQNTLLKASTETIQALKDFNNKHTREAAKEKKKELAAAIVEARRDGDVETEIELTEQLTETTAALKEAEKAPEAKPAPQTTTQQPVDPAFTEWTTQNPWFGQDKRRSGIALAVANELRAEPSNPKTGPAFYKLLTKELESTPGFLPPKANGASKVEGGRANGDGGHSGGKTYADLSQEAKATCDMLATKVVGKGRAFKDINEWRKHYAQEVLAE